MTMIIDGTNGITFPNASIQAIAGGSTYTTISSGNITTGTTSFTLSGISNTYDVIKLAISSVTGVTGSNIGLSINGYYDSSTNYIPFTVAFAPSGSSITTDVVFSNKRTNHIFPTIWAGYSLITSSGTTGSQSISSSQIYTLNSSDVSMTNLSSITLTSYYGNNFSGGTYSLIGIKMG